MKCKLSQEKVVPNRDINICLELEPKKENNITSTFDLLESSNIDDVAKSSNVCGDEEEYASATEQKLSSLEVSLHSCTTRLIKMLKKDPEEYFEPVEAYIKQFDSLKTNTAFVGALKTFGKYTGAALALSSS